MGEFHTTLFVLKQPLVNNELVEKLDRQLKSLNCLIEKENTLIVFNEGPEKEYQDEIYLNDDFSDGDILQEIKAWEYLGIIEYSSKELQIQMSVNYISLDGVNSILFDIGIPHTILRSTDFEVLYRNFIHELAYLMNVDRYCYNSNGIELTDDIKLLYHRLDESKLSYDKLL